MSPDDLFWLRVQRRVATLQPEVAAAVLRAFSILRDQLPEYQLAALIASQDLNAAVQLALSDAVLDRAFLPLRDRLQRTTANGFTYFTRDLPAKGMIDGTLAVSFNVLSPSVVDAIRALDTRVLGRLKDDVRETVRAYIENGLRDGVNPREVARSLRGVMGLAPNQLTAVQNFEASLRAGDVGKTLGYALRDRRFDGTVKKGALSEAQIGKMTEAYNKRMIAFNAETNARTATLDSFKLGQKLSWDDAVAKGIVNGDALVKSWKGVLDDREREEHVRMEGETVPYDEPFSNGEMTPGESTYNCRCVAMYTQKYSTEASA